MLYAALCDALLDYTISLILGGDDDTRHFIEQHLVSGTPLDRKRKMLRLRGEERKPDVAQTAPTRTVVRPRQACSTTATPSPTPSPTMATASTAYGATGESQPSSYSRPDRGAGATRKQCHSALDFTPIHLYGFDRRPPES